MIWTHWESSSLRSGTPNHEGHNNQGGDLAITCRHRHTVATMEHISATQPACRNGPTSTPSSLQSLNSTHPCNSVTRCLWDHEGSVVSAVTISSIPTTQERDLKLRLLPAFPDQHHPGQCFYTQISQPAAVKCPHRSYTFPHK